MDKKRLNAEEENKIRQSDIDAWQRGKSDAARDKLLELSHTITPDRAVKLVKLFASLGDIHYVAMKFDTTPSNVRDVLRVFDINSVEDARTVVNKGIIAELDGADAKAAQADEVDRREAHTRAQERLVEHQKAQEEVEKTPEEIDQKLTERRNEAQRLNKEDQLRKLIAEGLDPQTNTRRFKIPLGRVREFKQMIPGGVGHLRRSFGGSDADIVSEIKRLAPEYDIDMLRP